MNKLMFVIILIILSGCSKRDLFGYERGDLGVICKEDGTCNFDLECVPLRNKCELKGTIKYMAAPCLKVNVEE